MVLFVYVHVYVGDNECILINCKHVTNLLCVEKSVKNVYRFILSFCLYYKFKNIVIILSNYKNICIINSNGLRVSDNYVLYTVTNKL